MTITFHTKLQGIRIFSGVKSLTEEGGDYIVEYYTQFSFLEKLKVRMDSVLEITVNTINK